MTTFELKIKNTIGQEVTQTLTNEKSMLDETLQFDIDDYLHNYIMEFEKKNQDTNVRIKSIILSLGDEIIRTISGPE
jgi:hypothetical protein|tara:strand:+ start:2546 stop:2776 length:231 start_codon:yes stop_codon:yes gene_type:complete